MEGIHIFYEVGNTNITNIQYFRNFHIGDNIVLDFRYMYHDDVPLQVSVLSWGHSNWTKLAQVLITFLNDKYGLINLKKNKLNDNIIDH